MQTGKDNRNIFHWVFKTTEFTGKKATYIYIYIYVAWHSMLAQ